MFMYSKLFFVRVCLVCLCSVFSFVSIMTTFLSRMFEVDGYKDRRWSLPLALLLSTLFKEPTCIFNKSSTPQPNFSGICCRRSPNRKSYKMAVLNAAVKVKVWGNAAVKIFVLTKRRIFKE